MLPLGAVNEWAVTQYGETLATFPVESAAVNWMHKRQSQSIDWAVRNAGYDIVHIRGGKIVSSYRRDILGDRIKKAVAGKMDQEEIARLFEESVQEAFTRVYGFPKDISTIGKAIKSSFLEPGKKLGWTKPDPNVVLVLTEYAWVPDPFSSKENYEKWDQVALLLRAIGWPNAWTDSINSAVQVAYWRP